jgi:hypothetical protein
MVEAAATVATMAAAKTVAEGTVGMLAPTGLTMTGAGNSGGWSRQQRRSRRQQWQQP